MAIPSDNHENSLGAYALLRPLGHGGMGTVYLAHDPALNRQVAIKILRHSDSTSPRAAASRAKRFLREAQSTACLRHPHVVTIYLVANGPDTATPYLVMEYVAGGSLADLLRASGPMHWRDALAATRDVLRALAAAHYAGIVHRDIKPANLMRDRDSAGTPIIKLVDFGLARVASPADSDSDLTFPGAFVGSPKYSSPEQISGTLHIDGRADLYSLAATLYALLTGQPPFFADDPVDIMEHHLHDPFPNVRHLAPTAPQQVQELIARASQKNPENRFKSAEEMLAAVEQLLQLSPDIAATQPLPPPAPPPPEPAARYSPRADETIADLESRLTLARQESDSSTQIETLRSLYSVYCRLDRHQDATRAYRQALALHIKMHAPVISSHPPPSPATNDN